MRIEQPIVHMYEVDRKENAGPLRSREVGEAPRAAVQSPSRSETATAENGKPGRREQLEMALERVNGKLAPKGVELRFKVQEHAEQVQVEVVDTESGPGSENAKRKPPGGGRAVFLRVGARR
jgi:uncharacterized FlaG/YvyC family protein